MDAVTRRAVVVLRAEEALAHNLALAVLPRPRPSVWMILLPPLFVFFALDMARHKKEAKIFCDGFLLTKRLALDLALEEVARGQVQDVSFPDPPQGLGSPAVWKRIRAAQQTEIMVLRRHFCRLLRAPGETYADIVRAAYRTPGELLGVWNELGRAESAVNAIMLEDLHPGSEAREAASAMESALEDLRLEQVRRIFSQEKTLP
jgi:hypothetical protein